MTHDDLKEWRKRQLREQEEHNVSTLSPEQQREQLIKLRLSVHEALVTMQYARDGEITFKGTAELIAYIEDLLWHAEDATAVDAREVRLSSGHLSLPFCYCAPSRLAVVSCATMPGIAP